MSSGSIRIIQLPEKSSVNTDDYMAVDSSANGTKKVKFTDLLDDNLSVQNKAADAQATGEAINDISARVDNMISTQTNAEVTTLWTGTLEDKNQSVTLSESIANFDFIDIYGGSVDEFYIRKPVANTITFEIQTQNMSDNASVQFLRWWETGLSISGTTATITKCVKCYWDDFSQAPVVSQATAGINITRIDGVKIGHVENDEIVDARVGANGTTYSTLGDAIRGQVTDLESEITQYKSLTNTANVLRNPLFLDNNGWTISASGVIASTDTLANKVTITNSGTEQRIEQKIKLSDLTSGTYYVSYKKMGGTTPRIRIYTERDNSYYADYLVNVIDDHAEFVLDINAIQTADPLMTKLTIKFMLSSVGNSTISEPFLGIKNDYNGFWDKNFYNHENRLEALEQLEYASTLYGKKITFCGDSFTEGDFTGYVDSEGHSGTASDAYDSEEGMYKTFPYWIWKRTGCNKVMLAKSGYKLTNNATTSFTNSASVIYYQNIPIDSDIVVIQFGLNDLAYSDGTWDSSDATTWWGAFNEALNWITENIPKARILVIASDGDMTYAKRNLLNKMAVAWGCAFLDLKSLDVPLMLGGKYAEDLESKGGWGVKDSAKNRANAKYRVTESNTHPNVMAHLHRSYIIQDALEKL